MKIVVWYYNIIMLLVLNVSRIITIRIITNSSYWMWWIFTSLECFFIIISYKPQTPFSYRLQKPPEVTSENLVLNIFVTPLSYRLQKPPEVTSENLILNIFVTPLSYRPQKPPEVTSENLILNIFVTPHIHVCPSDNSPLHIFLSFFPYIKHKIPVFLIN